MQCNIDSRGKRVRLISGLVVCLLAVVLAALALSGFVSGKWVWIVAGCAALGGGFQIFEARAGWCVLRAMGIKTRL